MADYHHQFRVLVAARANLSVGKCQAMPHRGVAIDGHVRCNSSFLVRICTRITFLVLQALLSAAHSDQGVRTGSSHSRSNSIVAHVREDCRLVYLNRGLNDAQRIFLQNDIAKHFCPKPASDTPNLPKTLVHHMC